MRTRAVFALGCLCVAAFPAAYAGKKNVDAHRFAQQIPKDRRIDHALNRLTFGSRPGDAERVRAMGLAKWIDLQLAPSRVPENPVLEEKLKALDTLRMSGEELVRNYPTPQMVRQMVAGQLPVPSDPDRRTMLEKLVARAERCTTLTPHTTPTRMTTTIRLVSVFLLTRILSPS